MNSHTLLLVDDDELILMATGQLLRGRGYGVECSSSGEDAVRKVGENPNRFALVILDFRLGEMDGAKTAEAILKTAPDLFILIHSGDASREALKSSWRAGAVGFIEKGGDPVEFLKTVEDWCQKFDETVRTIDSNPIDENSLIAPLKMVGRSEALARIGKLCENYRTSPANVLILGETGTGKELIAKALHDETTGNYIAVNCASYQNNSEMIESELFGYERGAFTGAIKEKIGILEAAKGGTVFLDEVHHLSLAAQAKMLRAVQEKQIRRVGGTTEQPVSFRLVAAAKPDLEARIQRGDFLADLYHRLNVLTVLVPPLRERPEDIAPLVAYFTRKFWKTSDRRPTFLASTLKHLEGYPWPGNVRELENLVFRLLTECEDKVEPRHLDPRFFRKEPVINLSYEELQKGFSRQERSHIEAVLKASQSKLEAAKRLKISPSTLHSIMKRNGLYSTNEVSN